MVQLEWATIAEADMGTGSKSSIGAPTLGRVTESQKGQNTDLLFLQLEHFFCIFSLSYQHYRQ